MAIFKIGRLVDQLSWLKPRLVSIRLHDAREHGYREEVISDQDDRFVRFKRVYSGADSRLTRVALTSSRRLAEAWQLGTETHAGWRALRHRVSRAHRMAISLDGNVYDRSVDQEVMQFMRDLVRVWRAPDATIDRPRRHLAGVWVDRG
ncbi:MAG: hypothetical protein OER86_04130, partial [Phycisphaerae bacterium]|nr:hypothetical protein [Phycisphaerae bacterium]